jgi:hypothetical protein
MYFQQSEHNPPHIHAIYGEYIGEIAINDGNLLEGDLPPKALKLVQEWIKQNKDKLLEIWNSQEFKKLPPLS